MATEAPRTRLQAAAGRISESRARFTRNGYGPLGLALLAVYAGLAVLHPLLMRLVWSPRVYHPEHGFDPRLFHPSPPSRDHLLGTDFLGRDVLSMLMASAGPTLLLAASAACTTAIVAIAIAALSAYHRGPLDALLTKLSDTLLLMPAPLIMVMLGARFQGSIGPLQFGLLFGLLTGASTGAIVLRSHALTVIERPFVQAARVSGGGPARIMLSHLVPHLVPLASTYMLFAVTGAVVADAFVAALGLHRVRFNWGIMIYTGLSFEGWVPQVAWNVFLTGALAISVLCAAFYLVGLGLRQVANPRLAGE